MKGVIKGNRPVAILTNGNNEEPQIGKNRAALGKRVLEWADSSGEAGASAAGELSQNQTSPRQSSDQEKQIEVKPPHQPLTNWLIRKIEIREKNNGREADCAFLSKNRQAGQKANDERNAEPGVLLKITQKNQEGGAK